MNDNQTEARKTVNISFNDSFKFIDMMIIKKCRRRQLLWQITITWCRCRCAMYTKQTKAPLNVINESNMIQSESCHHMHPFVLLFYMFFDYSLLHFIWALFTSFGRIQKMDGITCWIESHQVDMTLGHICHYVILIFNKTKQNGKNEREKKTRQKPKDF